MRKPLIIPSSIFIIIALTAITIFIDSPARSQATSRGGELEYPSWDGVWNTIYGPMELGQVGSDVVGFYESDEGGGRIFGTVEGYKLTCTWTLELDISPTTGPAEFTISNDGLSFTGWWAHDYDRKTHNDWSGSKTVEREFSEELASVDYCLWRGPWDTNIGAIIFEQEIVSSEINGEILILGTQVDFDGTAEGWEAEIEFGENSQYTSGHLVMDPALNTFSGWLQDTGSDEHSDWSGLFHSGNTSEDSSSGEKSRNHLKKIN